MQPASLDLRLGDVAYRIRSSFLPDTALVERKSKAFIEDTFDLTGEGVLLESERPYLIPLKERLDLPEGVRTKANPKSSTGRIDVFTRVITDRSYRFDEIEPGYRGRLFLEVVPLSFPVRVRTGLTLNQVRLSVGRTTLTDQEVREFHADQPLIFKRDEPVPASVLALGNGMFLGLDLSGDAGGRVGYRAREHAPALDLTKHGAARARPVLGERGPGGRRPGGALAPEVLPVDVARGRFRPTGARGGDDRVRSDERRAADPLRRLLRPGFRL